MFIGYTFKYYVTFQLDGYKQNIRQILDYCKFTGTGHINTFGNDFADSLRNEGALQNEYKR